MSEVYDRISSQDTDWLRAQCEYLDAQKKFGIFPDFQEGDITFLPTCTFSFHSQSISFVETSLPQARMSTIDDQKGKIECPRIAIVCFFVVK